MNKLHQYSRLLAGARYRAKHANPVNLPNIENEMSAYMSVLQGELKIFTDKDLEALEVAIALRRSPKDDDK